VDLIDTHAHLTDRAYHRDRAAVLVRAVRDGIGIITIGSTVEDSRDAVRLAERHRTIWASVGVHPHGARGVDSQAIGELERLAASASVVAIGEIGLDYYRDLSPRPAQRRAFAEQLALARRLRMPVCLHNRDSTDDLIAILQHTADAHRGVVHSFLGDGGLAERFLALGLHLGVGGPLTYPKNDALRDAIRTVPLERVVIETDAPFLPPVPHRGERNEPAHVRRVAEEIARVRGIDPVEVARATTAAARRLFALPDPAGSGGPDGLTPFGSAVRRL